jgi:methylated-DNA-[protein]-cysteine S-methyltransferase
LKANRCLFCILNSSYGEVGLVWSVQDGITTVQQILLPREDKAMTNVIAEAWPGCMPEKGRVVPEVVDKMAAYLQGNQVTFSLNDLGRKNLEPGFRQQVLLENMKIPQGMVDTYSGLAARTGHPGAARAVGTALANNPFPLVIPCHRVVRAAGHIGCFGGGPVMKKRLLEMEGVSFDPAGRVVKQHFCR